MSLYASAASQEKLSPDPREPQRSGVILGLRPLARPLVPVTLALMAGIAAPAWGLRLPEPWLLAGALAPLDCPGPLLVAAASGPVSAPAPVRAPGSGLLPTGLAAGFSSPTPHQTAPKPKPDSPATLTGPASWGGTGPALDGSRRLAESLGLAMRPVTSRCWPRCRNPRRWAPACWSGGASIRPLVLQNPGTFNRPRFLAADGLFREVRLSDPQRLIFLAETQDYPWAERLRGGIRELLKSMDPAGRAIYLAMLLGDQGEVTQEMRRNLSRTGTSHLLVINGLHLGMVALVTYWLSFWLLRCFPRLLLRVNAVKIATLLAAIPVVFYAWVAGGRPPPSGPRSWCWPTCSWSSWGAPARSGAPWPWRPSSS